MFATACDAREFPLVVKHVPEIMDVPWSCLFIYCIQTEAKWRPFPPLLCLSSTNLSMWRSLCSVKLNFCRFLVQEILCVSSLIDALLFGFKYSNIFIISPYNDWSYSRQCRLDSPYRICYLVTVWLYLYPDTVCVSHLPLRKKLFGTNLQTFGPNLKI